MINCQNCNQPFDPQQSKFQREAREKQSSKQQQNYICFKKSEMSASLIAKHAEQIHNPLHAICRILDGSFGIGASIISISLKKIQTNKKFYKEDLYYLIYYDNAKNFKDSEIKESIFDSKLNSENMISQFNDLSIQTNQESQKLLKQKYGINIKFASLRIGSSCLFITKTVEKNRHFFYFSKFKFSCPQMDDSFNCFHYVISKNGQLSSKNNREIIFNNVKQYFRQPQQYQFEANSNLSSFIYIFEPCQIYKSRKNKQDGQPDIRTHQSQVPMEFSLRSYLRRYFLLPYLGKSVFIESQPIKFEPLLDYYMNEIDKNRIELIPSDVIFNYTSAIQEDEREQFQNYIRYAAKKTKLFRCRVSDYPMSYVLIYHSNRLIKVINTSKQLLCGFIEVNQEINTGMFKNRLGNHKVQKNIRKYLQLICDNEKKRARSKELYLDLDRTYTLKNTNF